MSEVFQPTPDSTGFELKVYLALAASGLPLSGGRPEFSGDQLGDIFVGA